MADPQCLDDWKRSDLLAEEAYRAVTTAFAQGQLPTLVQLEELQRLRAVALEKLRAMALRAAE